MDSGSPLPRLGAGNAKFSGTFSALAFNTMIVIDAALLSLWLANWLTTVQMFAVHLIGAGLVLAIAALLDRTSLFSALLEAGLCLLAGPLGTLVLLLARLGQDQTAASRNELTDLDDDTPKPLSPADAIHAMHMQGRRSMLHHAEDQSYADMLRHGDLLRHNEVIGAISRNYEPEMYPALSLALGSSSPALKVQAAAVFSKLRRTLGEEANDLLGSDLASLTPDAALEHHQRLLRVARSGFVDAGKVQALLACAQAIEDLGMLVGARLGLPRSSARFGAEGQPDLRKQSPRLKRYSCGGLG